MLIIPISHTEILFLGTLLVMWASLLFGGYILGLPGWTRLAANAVLVLSAWYWFVVSIGTDGVTLTLWLAIGMSFSHVADLLMARIVPISNPLLYAMGIFGIAHLAYHVGLLSIANTLQLRFHLGVWFIWLIIGAVGWYFFVIRGDRANPIKLAAFPYTLLIASTTGVTNALALSSSLFILPLIGAILFLSSDVLIALREFRGVDFSHMRHVTWFVYSPAQLLLVLGIEVATVVLSPTVIA